MSGRIEVGFFDGVYRGRNGGVRDDVRESRVITGR